MAQYSIDCGFDANFYEKAKDDALVDAVCKQMQQVWKRRMETITERCMPIITRVYETQGQMYQNISIPVSDGRKALNIPVNLERAYNSEGREIAKTLSMTIVLRQIDEHWKQHLRDMDDLKQSVQNASYEQKDPVVVYKLESYNLFADMLESLNKDVLSFLLRSFLFLREESTPQQAVRRNSDMSRMQARHQDLSTNGEQKANSPIKKEKTVGRNDPCPCGSGLKYKNCHGKGIV